MRYPGSPPPRISKLTFGNRMGRCFHLTKYGNGIVATNVIQAMINEQSKMMNQPADPKLIDLGSCPINAQGGGDNPSSSLPSASASSAPPSPSPSISEAPKAPYALEGGAGPTIGKCHVHVNEWQDCEGDAHNLATEVTIWDVGGNQIGYHNTAEAGAIDPLSVNSKLETPLVLVPEHQGDYVQFNLGTENFDSTQNDQTALSWCNIGGWDPREGPVCGRITDRSVSLFHSEGSLSVCADAERVNRNGRWTVISSVHGTGANHLTDRSHRASLRLGTRLCGVMIALPVCFSKLRQFIRVCSSYKHT